MKSTKFRIFSQQHKSKYAFIVVLCLSVVILSTSLIFYGTLENKVRALRGSASMLENTIFNPEEPRSSVDYWVYRGLQNSLLLNNELQFAETSIEVNWQNVSIIEQALKGDNFQSKYYANLANELTNKLVKQEKEIDAKGLEIKGTSFEPLNSISTQLVSNMQELQITFNLIQNCSITAQSGSQSEMDALKLEGIELTNNYYQAQALVQAAIITLPASNVNMIEPFVLITVLYAIFLLFPWVLLLLFFLRKRENLVNCKVQLIADLNMEKRSAEEIYDQAFRDIEYIVSLILFTIINAILLYFFFYPNATSGLAQLISNGGGIQAFSNYLADDATPITFGFLGAYFFVIQMLLRRYFSADLNPNAYNYAVVRMLTVFIFSVFLQLATSYFNWPPLIVSAVAFVIGIFPSVGLRWILKTTNKLLTGLKAPELIDKYPLTRIDGLNTWHEARLLEEKIENVQNLATASLDNLIINTNFSTMQLIDWIDQAILFVHTKEYWTMAFQLTGIRTATDLLDNTINSKKKKQDIQKINRIVKAINSIPIKVILNLKNQPKAAKIAASEFEKSITNAYDLSQETIGMIKNLDSTQLSLEEMNNLKAQSNSLHESCQDSKLKTENLSKILQRLQASQEWVDKTHENLKIVSESLDNLIDNSSYLIGQIESNSKEKFTKINETEKKIRTATEALNAAADEVSNDIQSATAPIKMTSEILSTIVKSMQRDPNTESIQNYWRNLESRRKNRQNSHTENSRSQ
jgi:hypothetical protein